MAVTPFRRSVKADTKRTGGRGGKGNFYEKWRPAVDVPSAFMLINAEYIDPNPAAEELFTDPATGRPGEVKKLYKKVRKHKRKLTVNGRDRYLESICSAGFNPHNPQPCAGCSAMDQGDRSVGVSDVAVFGIVHLATYHRHPMIDKQTGGYVVKQNQQNRGPGGQQELVMIDDECTGRLCNYCRILRGEPVVQDPAARNPFPQYRPQDIQTFFGKRRYMELGKNHLQNLGAWDATIASVCANDGMQLITDGFKCPTCGTVCIDMGNPQETRTDAQIQEAVSKPYPCMRCQRPVMLEEVVACETCEQNNRQPRQFTLVDRVLWGMRQGEGTASQLNLHRHESPQEFFARVPPQLLGNKSWDQLLADLAKPYDFDKLFEPKPIGEQMRDLELTGTQGPVPQYQQMPAYGAGQAAPTYGQAPVPPPGPGPLPPQNAGPLPAPGAPVTQTPPGPIPGGHFGRN